MKSYSLVALYGALASAQSSSAPAAAAMTGWTMSALPAAAQKAPSGGMIIDVTVGGMSSGGSPVLQFTPENVVAKAGDMVRFNFMQSNHSLVESTFDAPCTPKAGGVTSGFMPNPEGKTPAPTFDFNVTNTDPVFMFCEQGTHCETGMVFTINAAVDTGKTTDETLANFKVNAVKGNKKLAVAQGIVAQAPVMQQAAGQTVTVSVAGAAAATAGGAAAATTVAGQGTTGQGETCSCSCLCGTNTFPQNAGVGMFGGFLGEMPAPPQPVVGGSSAAAGVAAPSGAAPAAAAMAPPAKRLQPMPPMRRNKA